MQEQVSPRWTVLAAVLVLSGFSSAPLFAQDHVEVVREYQLPGTPSQAQVPPPPQAAPVSQNVPAGPSIAQVNSQPQPQVQVVNPVYEPKNAWKFKNEALVFFNPSPNPDGSRWIVWKDYQWKVTETEITVIDPRPYGTTLKSPRRVYNNDGELKDDQDVMDDLKDHAKDIRNARDPDPVPDVRIGVGFGFYDGYHHGHRHRGHYHRGHHHSGGSVGVGFGFGF